MDTKRLENLKNQITELENQKLSIHQQINNIKLEIADIVLESIGKETKNQTEETFTLISVVFNENGNCHPEAHTSDNDVWFERFEKFVFEKKHYTREILFDHE